MNAGRIHRSSSGRILPRRDATWSCLVIAAFGRRGYLSRKVRAVVKEMKDREHVIAQGQENSARANLSFIEKALFAARISLGSVTTRTTPPS